MAYLVNERFVYLVDQELTSARSKYPEPFQSWYAVEDVIQKQLRDMNHELFRGSHDTVILGEIIQIAAMCARGAHDLGLM